MSDGFELDARIAAATLALLETELCLVRLMNDSRYPWLVLIPRREGVVELFDLAADDRHRLIDLASQLAESMAAEFGAEKMNVGSLGNRVRPFHFHVVVRHSTDAVWPDAVWNGSTPVAYTPSESEAVLTRLRRCLPPG